MENWRTKRQNQLSRPNHHVRSLKRRMNHTYVLKGTEFIFVHTIYLRTSTRRPKKPNIWPTEYLLDTELTYKGLYKIYKPSVYETSSKRLQNRRHQWFIHWYSYKNKYERLFNWGKCQEVKTKPRKQTLLPYTLPSTWRIKKMHSWLVWNNLWIAWWKRPKLQKHDKQC